MRRINRDQFIFVYTDLDSKELQFRSCIFIFSNRRFFRSYFCRSYSLPVFIVIAKLLRAAIFTDHQVAELKITHQTWREPSTCASFLKALRCVSMQVLKIANCHCRVLSPTILWVIINFYRVCNFIFLTPINRHVYSENRSTQSITKWLLQLNVDPIKSYKNKVFKTSIGLSFAFD